MVRSINVLGQEVRVIYDHTTLKKDELGLFDSTNMTIYILPSLIGHPIHKNVIIHELSHAIFHITGASHSLGDGVEELLCTALEFGLKQFISFGDINEKASSDLPSKRPSTRNRTASRKRPRANKGPKIHRLRNDRK